MAKNKNKKQTSIYVMALLAIALLIAGALIYLWVQSSTPASEASTRPFVDHTNTMNFNGREDTLVLGVLNANTVRRMQDDATYDGDPILRTEKQIKEIQALVQQAENLVAAATGNIATPSPIVDEPAPPSGEVIIRDPIDNVSPAQDDIPPIDEFFDDDFLIDRDQGDDSDIVSDNDDIPVVGDEPTIEEAPKSWLQKTGDSIKSFFGRATDTVKGWFGIKKQTSPIIQEASLLSFKAENLSIGGAKLTIKGNNLKVGEAKNMAPEKGSRLTVFFEDFSNQVFKDIEFLVSNNEIIVYYSEHFKELTQVYFESPTLGLKSTSNGITIQPVKPKETAPITGGEPLDEQAEPTLPPASLNSFRAENLAIGGSKIVISGKNLKINELKNAAPEENSRLTVFFDDFSNKVYKDNEFLVWHDSITVYSSEKVRKITQIYFESPTLGMKSTNTGITITQAPINQPKITGYKVEHYSIYETLVIKGENLLISSNRSDDDEQIVVTLKDRSSKTYNSNQFYGSQDTVYIIGNVDEFKNISTIYFESRARGLSSTTNQISFVNIMSFVVNKVSAATPDSASQSARTNSRQSAYADLEQRVDNAIEAVATNNMEIIQWIVSNKLTSQEIGSIQSQKTGLGHQSYFESYSEATGNNSMVGFLDWQVAREQSYNNKNESATWSDVYQKYIVPHLSSITQNNYSPNRIDSQLKQAKKSLSSLESGDLVLKTWREADEYQNTNTFPIDFTVRYSSNGVIFAELHGLDSEVKFAIDEITNNKTMLNALRQVGRPNAQYASPQWIREAEKTAQNTGFTGVSPMVPTVNQQITF